MRPSILLAALLLAASVLAGCDVFGGDPNLSGTYTGSYVSGDGGPIDASLTIRESDGDVSGSLTLRFDQGGVEIESAESFQGGYDHPDLLLQFRDPARPFDLLGTVSDDGDRIRLAYNESEDYFVTLARD